MRYTLQGDVGYMVRQHRRFKSTLIPDFLHMACELADGADGILQVVRTRHILINEIKPMKSLMAVSLVWQKLHSTLTGQMGDQAEHAFAEDKNLNVIGCIAAVGPYWYYGEINRLNMSPSEDPRNPTYSPSQGNDEVARGDSNNRKEDHRMAVDVDSSEHVRENSNSDTPVQRGLKQQLLDIFSAGALHILDGDSPGVFEMVLQRILELNKDFFDQTEDPVEVPPMQECLEILCGTMDKCQPHRVSYQLFSHNFHEI
ncbi:hypothetical protein SERLA73DRAFT_163235 [Serpula lacrymans var. lacrymans S7.3]|uniref:Uncharacterized protein n=2 Tax=Serpula lacrymans var. lacrymans TaxID=341189 RepID=F8QD42_SERL3|nr:uncharacterized protein SERLADRAFT_479500 [Serpula lacrymans var. lacrymans S7.9]EGN93788.1 hypothetical protein SERLA73DRAFT_163235 [Serpula lacrymans var. lacrymans S7.3]EGO19160.1 hypothetical protein SERLADRAFT_479500 [Serpula lacrymans var. lacrymans S7.9]